MAGSRGPSGPSGRAGTEGAEARNLGLLRAAYDADLAGLQKALKDGAEVDTQDQETGLTALHIAVGMNNLPMTKLLIESWSSAFMPDGNGRWPTVIAAECRVSEALCDYIVEEESAWLEGQSVV